MHYLRVLVAVKVDDPSIVFNLLTKLLELAESLSPEFVKRIMNEPEFASMKGRLEKWEQEQNERVRKEKEALASRMAADRQAQEKRKQDERHCVLRVPRSGKRELEPAQIEHLIVQLRANFANNGKELPKLHPNVQWAQVEASLRAQPKMMRSLSNMEETGGVVDVIAEDDSTFLFGDTSKDPPDGRRNVVFDKEAEAGLPKGTFNGNAVDIAAGYGADLMSKDQYFALQQQGNFDTQRSDAQRAVWLKTQGNVSKGGNALHAGRVDEIVFAAEVAKDYHDVYMGFRCVLRVTKKV